MRTSEAKKILNLSQQKANGAFFLRQAPEIFFGMHKGNQSSFFKSEQSNSSNYHSERNMIQRQEHPEPPVTKEASPQSRQSPAGQETKPTRASKCKSDPTFPDLGCFAEQLKLDIDDNLFKNAHQFYRVASLYPGDDEAMTNTFLRYGLGANLLQTTFGFLGSNKELGKVLSYGTGAGLKAYDLYKTGELKLDIPISLGKGISLDIKFDLTVDPGDPTDVKGVNTTVGIFRRF